MIPAAVTTGVEDLNASLAALGPYLQASGAARQAFRQQTSDLLSLIETSIINSSGLLDSSYVGAALPSQTASDLSLLVQIAGDQETLAELSAVLGRMLLNVEITDTGTMLQIIYASAQPPAAPGSLSLDFSNPANSQYFPGVM